MLWEERKWNVTMTRLMWCPRQFVFRRLFSPVRQERSESKGIWQDSNSGAGLKYSGMYSHRKRIFKKCTAFLKWNFFIKKISGIFLLLLSFVCHRPSFSAESSPSSPLEVKRITLKTEIYFGLRSKRTRDREGFSQKGLFLYTFFPLGSWKFSNINSAKYGQLLISVIWKVSLFSDCWGSTSSTIDPLITGPKNISGGVRLIAPSRLPCPTNNRLFVYWQGTIERKITFFINLILPEMLWKCWNCFTGLSSISLKFILVDLMMKCARYK